MVVGFGFKYLTSLAFLLTTINSLTSSMSEEGCKGIPEGRNKRPRYRLNFNFLSGFNNRSVGVEILPESK